MKKLTVEITGKSISDLEQALDEIKRLVSDGFTTGHDSRSTGSHHFRITNEKMHKEEE